MSFCGLWQKADFKWASWPRYTAEWMKVAILPSVHEGRQFYQGGIACRQVLSWMTKVLPGLRRAEDQELDTIWSFFCDGEAEVYETSDGDKVYLAEAFFERASENEA